MSVEWEKFKDLFGLEMFPTRLKSAKFVEISAFREEMGVNVLQNDSKFD